MVLERLFAAKGFLPWKTSQRFFSLQIAYGSQSGNAMTFAHDLAKTVKKQLKAAKPPVYEMNQLESESKVDFKEGATVFVVSNYGSGEAPDNAKDFYAWLLSPDRKKDEFRGGSYALFGLGKSATYPVNYQKTGKVIEARLNELGMVPVLPRGEGDDDGTLETQWDTWKEKLLPLLQESSTQSAEAVKTDKPAEPEVQSIDKVCLAEVARPTVGTTTVLESRPLAHSVFYSAHHVVLDVPNSQYEAGDHLGVRPQNREEHIWETAARLKVDMQKIYHFKSLQVDETLTFHDFLKYWVDLNGAPKRGMMEDLTPYVLDPNERTRFSQLNTGDLAARFWNPLILLRNFPSLTLTPEEFLDISLRNAPLQPRFYSIASAPSVHQGVHLCVKQDIRRRPDSTYHLGLTSTMICQLKPGDKLETWIRPSTFRLPASDVPVILIAAGAGIASIRGLAWERMHQKPTAPTVLYFGCNARNIDWLYGEELTELGKSSGLEYYPAFALEENKEWVQHMMVRLHTDKLRQLILGGARVYICGNPATVGKGAYSAFSEIMKGEGGSEFMEAVKKQGRYFEDLY